VRTLDLTRCGAVVAIGLGALVACDGDDDGTAVGAASRSVDIGDGRTLFLECMGEGSPTVILESGIHDSSEYWTVSQLLTPAVDPPVMHAIPGAA